MPEPTIAEAIAAAQNLIHCCGLKVARLHIRSFDTLKVSHIQPERRQAFIDGCNRMANGPDVCADHD